MKKQFLNLGKALSKAEQRSVNGGILDECSDIQALYCDCPSGTYGNAEGCGCNSDNDCIMGECWKGIDGHGIFGMCRSGSDIIVG